MGKIDSAFHPFCGYKRVRSLLWELTLGVSRQTGHLTGTYSHAPQGPRLAIDLWEKSSQTNSEAISGNTLVSRFPSSVTPPPMGLYNTVP
ncbi:hypothetical protein TNCV_2476081 [Trichonephila clavipes]|nr:hypothetical protein TNCV_2476081 [Trichonephila clavipes]